MQTATFTIPATDYRSLYEIRTIDFSKCNPMSQSSEHGIDLNEPLVNMYEAGSKMFVLPFSGHAIIVSNLLDVSFEDLCEHILQEDEKEIVAKSSMNALAVKKLCQAAMNVEGVTEEAKLVDCDRWQVCMECFEDNVEFLAEESLTIVEHYYREILTKS